MKLNNKTIQKDEIPETFANYFNDKINNLTETCKMKIKIYLEVVAKENN